MRRRLKSIAAVLLTLILVCLAAFGILPATGQRTLTHRASPAAGDGHHRPGGEGDLSGARHPPHLRRNRFQSGFLHQCRRFYDADVSQWAAWRCGCGRSETIAEDIAKTQSFSQIGITWRDADETVKLAKYTVQIYDTFQFYYQMEGKTNKLLSIYLRDERLTGHTESQKMGLMRDFISYLGLDLVDDWVYSSEGFSSQKAQLQIYGSMGKGELALEVVPSGLYQTGTWRKRFLSNFFLIQPNSSRGWQSSSKPQEFPSEQEEEVVSSD